MSHFATALSLMVVLSQSACRILIVTISRSYLSITHVAFRYCPSAHSHTQPVGMSHFDRAHVTVISVHHTCCISVLLFSSLACPSHGHVCPSHMSHFDHAYLTVNMSVHHTSHSHHSCLTVMSFHHTQRTLIILSSFLSNGHVFPPHTTQFDRAHITVMSAHQTCRTSTMLVYKSCLSITHNAI